MTDEGLPPDPELVVRVLVSTSLQEAHLIAGRLEAEGIRAMVSPGESEPGPWSALPVPGLALVPNSMQRRIADVLVAEEDLEAARRILAALQGDD